MNDRERMEEAVYKNNLEDVKEMLLLGFDPNTPLREHQTALTIVQSVDMARLLIAHGAKVSAEHPEDGYTSLHWAAGEGRVELLTVLLRTELGTALGIFDEVSRTPLICAVDHGCVACVRLLLDAGSDVNANDEPRIGNTALHYAVEKGHVEIFKLLLDAGADPDIEGWMRLTPRFKAEHRNDAAGRGMVNLLKKRKG